MNGDREAVYWVDECGLWRPAFHDVMPIHSKIVFRLTVGSDLGKRIKVEQGLF